jgi:hypothetical protein
MQIMRSRPATLMLATGVLIVAISCDKSNAPGAPSPPGAAPVVTSVSVSQGATIGNPGESVQLTATAVYSDGSSRDVTSIAVWSVSSGEGRILSLAGPGLFRAVRYGIGTVDVTYTRRGSATIRVAPLGASFVGGTVMSETGLLLAGVTVEATSAAGTLRTTPDEFGFYAVPAMGDTLIRATLGLFETLEKRVVVSSDMQLPLSMRRASTPDAIGGRYQVTITASPSCALPVAAMARQYDTVVEETPSGIFVAVTGQDMVVWGGRSGFTGTRNGNNLQFTVRDTFDDGYNLIERIPGVGDLYYSGTATTQASGGTILGATILGVLTLGPSVGAGKPLVCQASDHRIAFAR